MRKCPPRTDPTTLLLEWHAWRAAGPRPLAIELCTVATAYWSVGPPLLFHWLLLLPSVAGVYLRGGGTRSYRRLRESGNDAPGLGPWSAIPRGVGGRMCSHQLSWLPVAGRPVCQKNRLSPHQPPHIELPTCTSAACTLKPPRALPEVCS